MIRAFFFAVALALGTINALAEELIVGNWKTATGDTAAISPCGGGYCVTLQTGKFAGKQIGIFSGSGSKYTGKITDLANNKTYDGMGSLSGNSLKLEGCVLKIICQSQIWTRL